MQPLPQRRELRAWIAALLVLALLPPAIALTDPDFGFGFQRAGIAFPVMLALTALIACSLLVDWWMAGQPARWARWTAWRRSPLLVLAAALPVLLWAGFAILTYEVAGLAVHSIFIRLSLWLGVIAWWGFLLRLADFNAGTARRGGRLVRFGLVQLIFLVMLEVLVSLVFPNGLAAGTAWYAPGPPIEWRQWVGWASREDATKLSFSPGEFTVTVQTNTRGLRDHETPYDKPADTYRVLILGDSTTYANEVNLNDAYHVRLEEVLSTEAQRVEFVAGAIGGWGTDQQLQYFIHEGCRYQPDLVLLQMSDNDIINNYQPFESAFWGEDRKPYYELDANGGLVLRNAPFEFEQEAALPDSLQAVNGQLRIISRTYLVLMTILTGEQRQLDTTETLDARMPAGIFLPLHIPDRTWEPQEQAYATTGALLRELKAEVEACGASLAAFIVPTLHPPQERTDWPDRVFTTYPEWDGYDAGYSWDFLLPEKRMSDLAREAGIPIMPYQRLIALYDAYYAEHGTLAGFTYRWVAHFSPGAHQQFAGVLADWLREEALVPAS